MPDTQPTPPVHDELWRHLDWSFWGTGMADVFREPLAESMLAGITPEQREQANALITRWREHREFVGRDKYEEQKAEIEQLQKQIAEQRDRTLTEAAELLKREDVGRRNAEFIKHGFFDHDTVLQSEAVERDAGLLLAARTTTAQEQPR